MITESALEEFRGESKKWLEDGLGFLTTPIKYVELLELTERLIAAEKDAARYRWLRDESAALEVNAPLVFNADEFGTPSTIIEGDHLDVAVDEAMKCSK